MPFKGLNTAEYQRSSFLKKAKEIGCRSKEKLIIFVSYSSLRPHDNEPIPPTTTALELPCQGGHAARVWRCGGFRWALPLSA